MATDRKLVIIGGGEHGRVVAEAALSSVEGWSVLGFVDKLTCPEMIARFSLERLGDDAALRDHPGAHGVLGFGAFKARNTRAAAVRRIEPDIAGWATVTHRTAFVSPTATIGKGTVVMAAAVIQTGARIGDHCVINSGAIIEHDVVVEDYAQIGPGAVVGGAAVIGRAAYVGLGASVRDHVRIGSGAVVGMGAAVVRDIPDDRVVRGVPAR
jgi:sugar O-acyltransferase (sialic acid O-acetyltransferase NeuD family)